MNKAVSICLLLVFLASTTMSVDAREGGYFCLDRVPYTVTFNGVTVSAAIGNEEAHIYKISVSASDEVSVSVEIAGVSHTITLNPTNGFNNSALFYGNSTDMVNYSW